MPHLSRRRFLASSAAVGAAAACPLWLPAGPALAGQTSTIAAGTRTIEVNGRAATVFGLTQPDGTHGFRARAGDRFRVRLDNRLDEATLIHWHGLTPPADQDGVPDISQPLLLPGEAHDYDFLLNQAGTNWMHSHHGLQEQRLLAAPLIVRDPAEAGADVDEVIVLFHDFAFRDPEEVLAGLRQGGHGAASEPAETAAGHGGGAHGAAAEPAAGDHAAMGHGAAAEPAVTDHAAMGHGAAAEPAVTDHAAMGHGAAADAAASKGAGMAAAKAHLNDVAYDAFLANDRTLDDPQVFQVERGGRVRLRLINGASATNFWIDLGRLEGRLIAVDGVPVEPLRGQSFEFAIAQRLDILLEFPREEGAWPIFAVVEGERARTGVILATPGASVTKIGNLADAATTPVGLALERQLRAARPLSQRPADRQHLVRLSEAPGYLWMLNGTVHGEDVPLRVAEGERVEITFVDDTTMAHPMHLHGHHFQVVAINGERFAGAVRDTILVPPQGSVTIAFDASNPGQWPLHCHHLYHMAGGMMTTIEYEPSS